MLKEGGEGRGERGTVPEMGDRGGGAAEQCGRASRRRCSARGLDEQGRGKGARGHGGHPSLVVGSHAGGGGRMEAGRAPSPLLQRMLGSPPVPLQAWSLRTRRLRAPCRVPSWASSSACREWARCWAPASWHCCPCPGAGSIALGTLVSVGPSLGSGDLGGGRLGKEVATKCFDPRPREIAAWTQKNRVVAPPRPVAHVATPPRASVSLTVKRESVYSTDLQAPSCFWKSVVLAEGSPFSGVFVF